MGAVRWAKDYLCQAGSQAGYDHEDQQVQPSLDRAAHLHGSERGCAMSDAHVAAHTLPNQPLPLRQATHPPEGPTRATFFPAGMVKEISSSVQPDQPGWLNDTLRNSICPRNVSIGSWRW